MSTLSLKKFNPATMTDDKVCVFIGKRNTGKSVLVTDILYHKKHIPVGVVMSGTEEGNHHYQKFVPDIFIHGKYDKESIERAMARQKNLVNLGRTNCNAFILLDDCMYDKKFLKDECMREMFMNGRHWKIFFMLTMQYCMDLSPDLRTNIDYLFILKENILQNKEKLYKNFFGMFANFKDFCTVMDACTSNFGCLVLDNTSRSTKIEDCVYYYKADLHPNFRVGSPAMWAYANRMYNPKHNMVPKPQSAPAASSSQRRAPRKEKENTNIVAVRKL